MTHTTDLDRVEKSQTEVVVAVDTGRRLPAIVEITIPGNQDQATAGHHPGRAFAPRGSLNGALTGGEGQISYGRCLMPLMKLDSRRSGSPVACDVGQPAEQLAEHHRDLAAGQVGAEAEVRARAAEADVVVRGRGATSKRYGSSKTASSRLAEL